MDARSSLRYKRRIINSGEYRFTGFVSNVARRVHASGRRIDSFADEKSQISPFRVIIEPPNQQQRFGSHDRPRTR